jgi:xylulokinase
MLFCGIDIGTSGSKGVVVDKSGAVLAQARRSHTTANPHSGWYEHDAESVWWANICGITRELASAISLKRLAGIAVSGIGPCTLVCDAAGTPLRPAILYGIDSRAGAQITSLTERLGAEAIVAHGGNPLTSQAVAPKLAWVAENEPEIFARAARVFNSSSYAAYRLTGTYVLDRYSASASDPLYELNAGDWWEAAWQASAPNLEKPRLVDSDEVVGAVTAQAAAETSLPVDTPVAAGTIDALAEAYSVGCRAPGDTMLMYGSTLFMIQVLDRPTSTSTLWAAAGRTPETCSLAAGMSAAGLLTQWFSDLSGEGIIELFRAAGQVPAGARGLLCLPYFAGERTPINDPDARGALIGLRLDHSRADIFRALLEAVAFGIRHNLDAMRTLGHDPKTLFAVGGGSTSDLWPRITSNVTGLSQRIAPLRVGAAYGDARMAADAAGVDTSAWNIARESIEPDTAVTSLYEDRYQRFRALYPKLADDLHALGV